MTRLPLFRGRKPSGLHGFFCAISGTKPVVEFTPRKLFMGETMTNIPAEFAELGLSEPLLKAIAEMGYETPSDIQKEAIPHILQGKDILGLAQTGTGKTAAFALPLLQRIDVNKRSPQLLVLAPTRELALQVSEAFQAFARYLGDFHVLPVYGGQGMDIQLKRLKRGVHVVVGTPGRIQDHMRRGTLQLDSVHSFVLDEADEMLNMGFQEEVEYILEHVPENRQVALFSATMPEGIRRVTQKFLRDPVHVRVKSKTKTVENIEQLFWKVSGVNKLDAIHRFLDAEAYEGVIVFVRTRNDTLELAEKLLSRGFTAAALNGDIQQNQRQRIVDQLKSGQLDIVVATDVAARGIDVSRVTHVINYDIPTDPEAYVHRIGRTGRAGRSGKAILFVSPREMRMLQVIEKTTGSKIKQINLPSRLDIRSLRIERFKKNILEIIEIGEHKLIRGIVEEIAEESGIDIFDIAGALAHLAQKETPLMLGEEFTEDPEDRYEQRDRASGENRGREKRDRDREPRESRDRGPRRTSEGMAPYKIAVGKNDGAMPGEILGAILNETGMSRDDVGSIAIQRDFSLVELPADLSNAQLADMKKIRVRGKQLLIEKWKGEADFRRERDDRPPRKVVIRKRRNEDY